jgi:hypothetical protein
MKEIIFTRTFENNLYENESGGIAVKSHMFDVLHDMTLSLDVSLPDFVISNASLEIVKAPGERCQELCPKIIRLNGQRITHGFTRLVRTMYGKADGCPNIVNMLLSSVPLAINTSWMIAMKHGVPSDDIKATRESQMKDICISFSSRSSKQ